MSTSVECEGFICPYCLVGFSQQQQLQQHFLEMHSGLGIVEQDDYDVVEYIEDESSSPTPTGHVFKTTQLPRPRSCDVCSEIIWQEGLVCQQCHITLHTDICEDRLTDMCTGPNSTSSNEDLAPTENHERKMSVSQQLGINKGLLNIVKTQVSKGRNRYQNEEFDLDLTYITERIIAMSFPASGVVESAYRNNLKDVAKMLKTKHQDNYMVFNLSERSYDISRFNNQVLDFGWPDHLAPSLERLSSVCKSIRSWLDSDPSHVAVVHCKGGKGRTGCVIAAFMHYTEICHSAAAALDRFAMKRFYDNKCGGVTQPSQRKYVHYFADLLAGRIDIKSAPIVIHHVLLHGIPNLDGKGGCRIFIKIYENMTLVHTSGLYTYTAENDRIKISIYEGLTLQGEVLLKCFHKRGHTGMDSVFRCQFPTAAVKDDLRLVYNKADLDDAFKDKKFPDMKVELLFREAEGAVEGDGMGADLRSSLLDNKQVQSNGSTDLSHDKVATRDSYAGFTGGTDDGLPFLDGGPDLMGHDTPMILTRRDRTDTSNSFKMNPEDLERVTHQDEVYTVVSKQFKQGGAQRESGAQKEGGAQSDTERPKPPKLPGNVSEGGPQRAKLRASKSIDLPDGGGQYKPPRPVVPPHRYRAAGKREDHGPNPIPQQGHAPHLPPPQIVQKQRSADLPFVQMASCLSPRPPSAPLLDTKYDVDYEDIDETESPPSSEGNSPMHLSGRGNNQLPLVIKQQQKIGDRIGPDVAQRQNPPRPKPVPAAKPGVQRENKKQELHLKYKKIQDEILRKQEANGAQNAARGHGRGGGAVGGASGRGGAGKGGNGREQKPNLRGGGPDGSKLKHRPSYAEVDPDQEITVEEFEGEGEEAALWGLVRYPVAKKGKKVIVTSVSTSAVTKEESMGKRSSSSSNLTGSDFYSNLMDLELEPTSQGYLEPGKTDSLGKKSHSFSEGIDKIVIAATNGSRDSIIDIRGTPQFPAGSPIMDEGNFANPDYKNLQYDEDGTLDLRQDEPGAHSFSDQIKMLGGSAPAFGSAMPPGHSYENMGVTEGAEGAGGRVYSEDYVNDTALDDVHNYTNHDDLILQLQAENVPHPEEFERPLDSSQRLRLGSGASLFKLLKTTILKPKPPTEIHSTSITEEQGTSTLAPFSLSGINVRRVNMDYEAFKGSAWVDYSETPCTSTSGDGSVQKSRLSDSRGELQLRSVREEDRERRPRPSLPQLPVSKHRAKTDAAALGASSNVERPRVLPHHSPQLQRKAGVPLPPPPNKRSPIMPPTPTGGAAGRPPTQSRPLPASPMQSSAFLPSSPPPLPSNSHIQGPRPHNRLQASHSDAPALPKPRLKDPDRAQSSEPRGRRPGPPKPPLPFHQSHLADSAQVSETQVRMLMQHWYKPKISREEAIELVLPQTAGSFIVRDSSTVKGGYALTLKITEAMVRHRKKMSPDDAVTGDMLVTHFLIQPDPQGVKLQGWSEKPFKSLPAFITSHVQEKLCLPCKLVLPDPSSQGMRRQPSVVSKALQSGASCELIYLGSVDVPSAGSDVLLSKTVQQLQGLDLSTMNIVTITVSREGITLHEDLNGSLLKRQYPFNLITYCGLEPNTRWNFPNLHHKGETVSLTDKICFGLVHRPQNMFGFSCMVFAEYSSSQPVSSVVNFIQKMMREHRHSNKYNAKS